MNAQIISIGTELTLGQMVDTNAAWLAQRLAEHGIACAKHVTVGDDRATIETALRDAGGEAELLLVTGGLGPTADDLTRQALADALGVPLRFDAGLLREIEAYFASRRREMHPENRVQAMIPVGGEPMQNTNGTAPGIHALLGRAEIFVMPGVPREMKAMFERHVAPRLAATGGGAVILQHTLHTFGVPEAEAGEKIVDLMKRGRNPTVGTSASDLIISIRINAHAANAEAARRLIEADAAEIRRRLGKSVYGEGGETLADLVAKMLTDRQETVSTAESCTGGLIAKRLTDVSGSSAYFMQSFVTYSNESKQRLLEIPESLIAAHGAVCAEVAEAMATNCRRLSGTDYALSATGIAGPTGGTPEKPVGLVFIAMATAERTMVKELRFGETLTRDEIRDRTAKAALNLLRLELLRGNR